MIKVLHIVDIINYSSGVSHAIINIIDGDNSKFKMDIMTHQKTPIDPLLMKKLNEMNVEVYYMPSLRTVNLLRYLQSLRVFFSNHEYDIVHGHISNAAVFYMKKAKKYGVKTRILHSHNTKGSDYLLKRFRNRLLNKMALTYSNVSLACSNKAGDYLFGDDGDFFVLYNGIDFNKFKFDIEDRNAIRERFNIENCKVIGHIGRFVKQKNHSFLVEVFEEVYSRDNQFRLVLVGDGPLFEDIKRLILEKGIDDAVIFFGEIEDPQRIMNAFDIFMLPSLYEGLPIVSIETQANGLPVILSDSITMESSISEGCEYISLNAGCDKWADRVCSVLNSNQIKREELMLYNSYKNFDIANQAQVIREMYIENVERYL